MPDSAAARTVTVIIDGRPYPLDPKQLTSLDTMALRQATGMSVRKLFELVGEDPDIDVIAAFAWLSRRAAGERALSFETVAAAINYGSTFTSADANGSAPAAAPEDGAPEA